MSKAEKNLNRMSDGPKKEHSVFSHFFVWIQREASSFYFSMVGFVFPTEQGSLLGARKITRTEMGMNGMSELTKM